VLTSACWLGNPAREPLPDFWVDFAKPSSGALTSIARNRRRQASKREVSKWKGKLLPSQRKRFGVIRGEVWYGDRSPATSSHAVSQLLCYQEALKKQRQQLRGM